MITLFKDRRWELALALSLLTVLAWIAMRDSGGYPVVFADEQLYSRMARLVPLREASVTTYLYFAAYGLTSTCGTGFLECARYLNALLFVGAAPFVYLAARQYASRPAAVMAALMAVLAPMNIYTAYFMPESMYLFVFWVLTWLVLTRSAMHWAAYAGSIGVLLGALMLVKVHGLFLAPAVVVYLVYAGWQLHRDGPWIKIALAGPVLALLCAFAVKFAVGYVAAGAEGLRLMGSIYETQAADSARSGVTVLTLLPGALLSLKGHVLMLCMVFGTPLAALLACLASPKARAALGAQGGPLMAWTILASGAVLGMAVFYTSSVAHSSPVEGLRLHSRYYHFVFPLLLIIAAAGTGTTWRPERNLVRWLVAAIIAAAMVYAVPSLPSEFFPIMSDGPEYLALGFKLPFAFATAVLVLHLLVLFLWACSARLGGHAFLFLFMPAYAFNAHLVLERHVISAHTASAFDRAGLYARGAVPEGERNDVHVIATGMGELLRVKFHLDAPNAVVTDVPERAPVLPDTLPGRSKWLLVIGDHPLPAEVTPVFRNNEYALVQLDQINHSLGTISLNGPLEGKLLARAEGMSHAEAFGRWTDGDKVRFHFVAALPRKLNVYLTARAFGPNAGKDFVMRVGQQEKRFRLPYTPVELKLRFDTDGAQRTIEVDVPHAVSPEELGSPGDPRKLGMGVHSMEIGSRER